MAIRIKGASANEGHPADAGRVHLCELMLLLLSPQDCDKGDTWPISQMRLIAVMLPAADMPLGQAAAHLTPHPLHKHPTRQVLFQPPLHWGKAVPQAGQALPRSHGPQGQRLRAGHSAHSAQTGPPPQTPRCLGHSATALMRRRRTLVAARPAAHPSFLTHRALGLFCNNRLRPGGPPQPEGEAVPGAPPPFSRDCCRGESVTQTWLLRCERKSAARGTASGKYFFCLTPLPSSQLEYCSVRHGVWSCGSNLVTVKPKAKNIKSTQPRMVKRKKVFVDIPKHLAKLKPPRLRTINKYFL